jgi:hypothetical protein
MYMKIIGIVFAVMVVLAPIAVEAADPSLSVSSSVVAGTPVSVSGYCGNITDGTVTVLLSNSERQTIVGTTEIFNSGNFSSSFAVPGTFPAGASQVVAFCPAGNVVISSITISAASATGNSGTVLGATTDNSGKVAAAVTPVGGVAAGEGATLLATASLLFIGLGLIGSIRQINQVLMNE